MSMDDFKAVQGISYSRLSKLANSPQDYLKGIAEDIDSSAVSLGSAVDLLLTDPENFEKEIYVMSAVKPNSDNMIKFVNRYLKDTLTEGITDEEALLNAYTDSGYKIKIDAVVKKFETEGKLFFDAILAAGDRKILGIDDLFKANKIVKDIQEHDIIKKYFVQDEDENIELMFQIPIVWEFNFDSYTKVRTENAAAIDSIRGKSILDCIRIDHTNKIITPVELKTGGEGFFKSYWRYKRYLQGGMYNDAVRFMVSQNKELKDYKVENIIFVYADTTLVKPPVIYRMTNNDLNIARNGQIYNLVLDDYGRLTDFSKYLGKYKTKGYKQLMSELEWHIANDKWEYSYDTYQSECVIDIDSFIVKL